MTEQSNRYRSKARKEQMKIKEMLTENLAQKETCVQSKLNAQERLTEIAALLKDPKSDAIALIRERQTLTSALKAYGEQIDTLDQRIAELQKALEEEGRDARKRHLQAIVEKEGETLDPILNRIEETVEQLEEALRLLYEKSQEFAQANAELNRSNRVSFGQVHLPKVYRNGYVVGVGAEGFDWVRPEIRAADYAARVKEEREAADRAKALQEQQRRTKKQQELDFCKTRIPELKERLDGVNSRLGLGDRERRALRQELLGCERQLKDLQRELAIA